MKPDNTQETIYVGLDTGLPPYLPYPRFLLKMDISQTAKLLYALLLDRTTLSQRNGWQDDQGRTFIVYRSRRPLIVTTNLTLQQIQNPPDTAHARIYDRLLEMCAPVRFTGGNFRRETAQAKLERLKNLMNE